MQTKIIIFYKYIPIEYPKQIQKWLQQLCANFNFKGRILLGTEGINATLGGQTEHIERFKAVMSTHPLFGGIDFKESPGSADDFPRMQIKIRKEIVTLGIDPTELTAAEGGKHLTPAQTHELISRKPENLVILDARNKPEWKIGAFEGAIKPAIDHFRELPDFIQTNADAFEGKQVLMYCTGGIRCERASAFVKKHTKAQAVYQMEGGIQRYTEQFPDGYFRGKNYVFDGRVSVRVNDDILAHCELCQKPCDEYANCRNAQCNKHFICCESCIQEYGITCSMQCKERIAAGTCIVRPHDVRSSAAANKR
jgi:predicted sulfurtransferase